MQSPHLFQVNIITFRYVFHISPVIFNIAIELRIGIDALTKLLFIEKSIA